MMTETHPTIEPPVRVMTLVYIKDNYSSKFRALALVENEKEADAITALIERSGAKCEVVDVPVWPNIKAEED